MRLTICRSKVMKEVFMLLISLKYNYASDFSIVGLGKLHKCSRKLLTENNWITMKES